MHGAIPHRNQRTAEQPSAPAWWTDADQAELDHLIWRLVNKAAGMSADELKHAVGWLVDWKRDRSLRSKATYLRAHHDLAERLRGPSDELLEIQARRAKRAAA